MIESADRGHGHRYRAPRRGVAWRWVDGCPCSGGLSKAASGRITGRRLGALAIISRQSARIGIPVPSPCRGGRLGLIVSVEPAQSLRGWLAARGIGVVVACCRNEVLEEGFAGLAGITAWHGVDSVLVNELTGVFATEQEEVRVAV